MPNVVVMIRLDEKYLERNVVLSKAPYQGGLGNHSYLLKLGF